MNKAFWFGQFRFVAAFIGAALAMQAYIQLVPGVPVLLYPKTSLVIGLFVFMYSFPLPYNER